MYFLVLNRTTNHIAVAQLAYISDILRKPNNESSSTTIAIELRYKSEYHLGTIFNLIFYILL